MEELIRVRMAAEALEEWAACEGPCLDDLMALGDTNEERAKWGMPKRGAPPSPRPAKAAAPKEEPELDSSYDSECELDKTVDLDDSHLDTSCSEREVRNDTILY